MAVGDPPGAGDGVPSTLVGTETWFISSRRRATVLGACAVAAIGGVGVFGSSIGAQTAPVVVEPVSVDAAVPAMPVGTDHSSPALSDTGAVVAFDVTDSSGPPRVWIRDRAARTTTPVAELVSAAPGMSGNGCLVAYSVPGRGGTGPTVSLTVVDRCATSSGQPLPAGTVIDTVPMIPTTTPPVAPIADPAGDPTNDVDEYAAPALSFDGATIVWSTGSEIRRYVRPTSITGGVVADHLLVDSFDIELVPSAVAMTGADVDISDDGTAVVFVAGPGTTPFAPVPGNVYVWSESAGRADPTIELLSRTRAGAPGADSSGSPTMSADGSLVLFDSTSTDLAAIGTDPVTGPFVVIVDRVGRGTRVLVDEAKRPAVSGDGRHVAYERAGAIRMLSSTDGTSFTSTTDREIDGLGDVDPVTGSVLSRFGRWLVFDSAQGTVLTDDVEFQTGVMVWAADLRASDDGSIVDTTTTTTTPTTPTTPTTTIVASNPPTVPTTTVAGAVVTPPVAVTPPPATTVPLGTLPPPRYPTVTQYPQQSSGSSGSTIVRSSAVVYPLVQPGTVVFEPTVVAAGRRTATVSLSNPAARTAGVVGARVDAAGSGAFSLFADNCTGQSLATGATCTVEVQFAPLVVGAANGLLTFDLADGTTVSAALVGEGSPEPTLDVVPGVAAPGQVVTVFGAGFPAGALVEFSRSGVVDVDQLTVDLDGTFAHVFVVLPNTPSGPMTLTVAAQPDLFGDVAGELLVSSRRAASTAVFRDGIGASLAR